jgi:hypothetical protein
MTDLPTHYVSIPRQMYYEFSSVVSISDRLKPDNRGRNERYPVRSEVGELAANSMVPDERWPQGASRPPPPCRVSPSMVVSKPSGRCGSRRVLTTAAVHVDRDYCSDWRALYV